jgi:hypothetical protein
LSLLSSSFLLKMAQMTHAAPWAACFINLFVIPFCFCHPLGAHPVFPLQPSTRTHFSLNFTYQLLSRATLYVICN